MAVFSPAALKDLKVALTTLSEPWILSGFEINESPTEGIIGFFDWRLHGIISKLSQKKALEENTLVYVPSKKNLGGASLLLFTFQGSSKKSTALVSNLKNLKVDSLCLLENTFPQDFLLNLKQTLTKAGIRWTTFEQKLSV